MSFEITSFKTDYAASGRSKCNRCRQPIDQDELRIGPMVQSTQGDFKYPAWHHFACFEDGWLPKHPNVLTNIDMVSGMDKLKFADQKKIKGLVVGGDSSLETKATTEEEKAIAADTKLIFNRKEKLDELELSDVQDLLDYNNQPHTGKIFGGRHNMLDRCAEAMAFGALAKCPLCKEGDLTLSHGTFKCTGNIDEFAKCEYKTATPKRLPFKIPKRLANEYSFLKSYTYKPRDRTLAKIEAVNPTAAANTAAATRGASPNKSGGTTSTTAGGDADAAAPVVGAKRAKKDDGEEEEGEERAGMEGKGVDNTPFYGCVILFCGKLSKTQAALKKIVLEHGGTVASSVGTANICVCTKEEAAGQGSQKGKDAVKAKLLCVGEEWMEECIKEGKRIRGGDITSYVLANPQTVDAERQKRAEVGAKLELAQKAKEEREKLEEKYTTETAGGGKSAAGNVPGKSTHKKLIVKGSAAVDPDSELVDEGHIYEPKKGEVYNSTLNLSDVSTGQNSFYILQIIEHDNKKFWTVFRKWGKVGNDKIQATKITKYPSSYSAINEFEKVFKEKTGNPWSDRAPSRFEKKYGKFSPVDVDYEGGAAGGDGGDGGASSTAMQDTTYNGPLDAQTQSLVKLLFDIQAMKDTLKEMEIDMEKMPLGKISKPAIKEAFGYLKELQTLIQSTENFDELENTAPEYTKCVSLSNRFYSKIPHAAEEGKKLPLLNDIKLIQEKTDLLTTLQDLEVASKMLSQGGGSDAPGEHPIDTHYAKLKTEFKTVPHKSDHFKMIQNYLQDTHAATHKMYDLHLVDLWEVDRAGEADRFKSWEDNKNRQLLWHGSRLTNWCGILSQGLRIAPPEAPSTGYMFGKGVYFADMSSKSANYCFTSSDKTTGVMMLAEVALGDMYPLKHAFFVDGLKAPYKSTKGIGKNHPDPKSKIIMENGTIIPTGKGVDSGVKDTTLMYNEFIVYDVSQIRIRYILRLDFRYKGKYGTFH